MASFLEVVNAVVEFGMLYIQWRWRLFLVGPIGSADACRSVWVVPFVDVSNVEICGSSYQLMARAQESNHLASTNGL